MTELVLTLCGAIVKTAFKLWSGDNAFADNVSGDLIDLIKSQVSGVIEQRNVRVRFDKIELIVANQLMALLNAEFRALDEGEKNAAILAVAETFGRSRLTDKALFAANLDPLYLATHVRKYTEDDTRDLSFGGVQLYDRLLGQCCAYIIEIADKLPRFQVGAFAELLNRDDQILARISEVLDRLPAPARDGRGTDRVETAYRQLIAKRFDRLDLFGFGLDFTAQWYALSIAYVNLTVSEWLPDSAGVDLQQPLDRSERFEEWLARYPRLLIEGRAGGGKTTVMQWIAVRAALRDFTGAAAVCNDHIPFFLRLRDYADEALPVPEQFLDKIASLLAPEAGSWPREQLRSGRALVLIDGLDEVPEPKRLAVLAWLEDLTELFPDVRYIVTTRPKALEDRALRDARFVKANLEPMDPALIRIFIDRWHAAMREWHREPEYAQRLDECRSELTKTLENDRFLGELANTPLLAGLICALNQHLNAQLPRRRGEIFEKALTMFHQRDQLRGINSRVTLDLSASSHLLGELALWMVRNGAVEVTAESACRTLERSATPLRDVPANAEVLYNHLLTRSGVLREPTSGNMDFVHRTFQEYLAARALINSDNIGEIIRNAGDDQWREIVVLATGLGNLRQTTDLMRGLLRKTRYGKNRYRRRLLAVASLDEFRGADPNVIKEIENVIPELLPPRSIAESEELSHAGERLIPHLTESLRGNPAANKIIPAIRAAALIGGPDALRLVDDLAIKARGILTGSDAEFVRIELIRGWQYFGRREYAERIIAPLGLNALVISDHQMLQQVNKFPALHTLTLDGFLSDRTDLSCLAGNSISSLRIQDCDIQHIDSILNAFPLIKQLTLVRCPRLRSMVGLARLTSLEELSIHHCESLESYRMLGELQALKAISFEGQRKVDLTPLKLLPQLSALTITNSTTYNIRELRYSSGLTVIIDGKVTDLSETYDKYELVERIISTDAGVPYGGPVPPGF